MRWELLFDDLEGQLAAADDAEQEAELRDRTRSELGRLRLVDRLRGSLGRTVDVRVPGDRVRGPLRRVGSDWFLLEPQPGTEVLVPVAAVLVLRGLGPRSAEPGSEGLVAARLDLRHALRGLSRDRSAVRACLTDGSSSVGVVTRVGNDHLELAEDPRRPTDAEIVPLAAVASLRRHDPPVL